jgi:hypothetical protein
MSKGAEPREIALGQGFVRVEPEPELRYVEDQPDHPVIISGFTALR